MGRSPGSSRSSLAIYIYIIKYIYIYEVGLYIEVGLK